MLRKCWRNNSSARSTHWDSSHEHFSKVNRWIASWSIETWHHFRARTAIHWYSFNFLDNDQNSRKYFVTRHFETKVFLEIRDADICPEYKIKTNFLRTLGYDVTAKLMHKIQMVFWTSKSTNKWRDIDWRRIYLTQYENKSLHPYRSRSCANAFGISETVRSSRDVCAQKSFKFLR